MANKIIKSVLKVQLNLPQLNIGKTNKREISRNQSGVAFSIPSEFYVKITLAQLLLPQ